MEQHSPAARAAQIKRLSEIVRARHGRPPAEVQDALERKHDKQNRRRFTAEPQTGFGNGTGFGSL